MFLLLSLHGLHVTGGRGLREVVSRLPPGVARLAALTSSPEQGCEAAAHPTLSGPASARPHWNPAPGSSLRGSVGAVGRRGPRASPRAPSTFALCFLLPSVPHLLLAAVRLFAEVGRKACEMQANPSEVLCGHACPRLCFVQDAVRCR
ncbi:unnamed protein product [Rangifer tarandus platyrhynchus]|uniref:Uncharacterized protein n=1 Tax=Rangifer tarandus platyrhynchus TaxID=3082113 RepID=A0AC59ZHB8_RANTA